MFFPLLGTLFSTGCADSLASQGSGTDCAVFRWKAESLHSQGLTVSANQREPTAREATEREIPKDSQVSSGMGRELQQLGTVGRLPAGWRPIGATSIADNTGREVVVQHYVVACK